MYVWTTSTSMKKERSVGGISSDNDPPPSTDLGYECVYICMYGIVCYEYILYMCAYTFYI